MRRAAKIVQLDARFSDCANKHRRKVTAGTSEQEQVRDEMAITQPFVRERRERTAPAPGLGVNVEGCPPRDVA